MKEIQPEPRWKRIARDLFFLFIIASAAPLGLAVYFEIQAHKAGAKQPTAEKSIEFVQHASKKYISPAESERIRLMWTIFLVCFPSAILCGFVLRFVFKVDILKDEPKPAWVDSLINDLSNKKTS